jgi:hypothetical protein
MDAFSEAMIEAHQNDEISHLEFLYVYSYMMTELNFQKLANMYVVGYDSQAPSYASRQFVHYGIIWKALKVITDKVAKKHNLKELFKMAEEQAAEKPLPCLQRKNKLLDNNEE